ncbi:translation initiation factor IF-2 [Patescibacteria group bacterium]|nr:translation initiation factor IF-2 [Patescibacteria group bacterium]MBU1673734.1 translation initiation factor IF-2 [Patescibacteria group bacterium]MBU1963101.1 translation initiation factor IF-2 [Patescibacteria group bacterium]
MNVTELTRKLKMTKEEFFPMAKELGFDIGERAIKIDDRIANKLEKAILEYKKQQSKKSLFEGEKTEKEPLEEEKESEKFLEIPDQITVAQFSEKLNKSVADVIAILMKNGIMATINENLDFETATIIAEDLGYSTKKMSGESEQVAADKIKDAKIKQILTEQKKGNTERPPVIVVMGHVDHGKTKTLDAIRKTNVVDEEAGGITQSIGAYQVDHNGKALTFIDTPGHEAFTAMRSRGANIADVAILVVAADDGIKPQTIEAIEIMEKAKLPFVVAINKIDKEGADIEKVKKGLSELNLIPEDWGGKTICTPISAKEGDGIPDLLDMVILISDMEKENIVADPAQQAVGTIIESKINKNAGPVATVLVQSGTLHIGDLVLVSGIPGKIKKMEDWKGRDVKIAAPSTPVKFLGLKNAPVVGDVLQATGDKKVLKQKSKQYQTFAYLKMEKKEKEKGKNSLPVIIKTDTLGSLEAIINSLNKFKYKEVELDIVSKALGNVTEKDIVQAESSGAVIAGFNVGLTPQAQTYSNSSPVEINTYKIIYELIDFLKEKLDEIMPSELLYNLIGKLKVLKVFKSGEKSMIIGGRVTEGIVKNKALIKVMREDKQIGEGTINQLQSEKKNVDEVGTDKECGVRFQGATTLLENDILEAYTTEEKKRELA